MSMSHQFTTNSTPAVVFNFSDPPTPYQTARFRQGYDGSSHECYIEDMYHQWYDYRPLAVCWKLFSALFVRSIISSILLALVEA